MIYKPPSNIAERDRSVKYVFLAGSIEMGAAEDWQTKMATFFKNKGYGVFNPRRDDWDSSWTQEYENPQFYQQVNWELDALDKSDIIFMYFSPNTKSPISLLELGLYATSKKIFVVCPDGFWRKGNVDIVCAKYNIPIFEKIDDFTQNFLLIRN
jgi:hypothetical protein